MIVSDLGDSYCINQASELVLGSLPPFSLSFLNGNGGGGWVGLRVSLSIPEYPRVSKSILEYPKVSAEGSRRVCTSLQE